MPASGERLVTNGRIVRMLERVADQAVADGKADDERAATLRDPARVPALDLSGIGATGLAPGSLSSFTAVRRLNLSDNNIAKLHVGSWCIASEASKSNDGRKERGDSQDVVVVPPITWLKASNNALNSKGVASVQFLTQLITLQLSHNSLERFPKTALKSLVNLKALVLDHNQLSELRLPKTLTKLNTLVVSHNQLSVIDKDRVLSRLPALAKLSASNNALSEWPDLTANPDIAEVRVAHNAITCVPEVDTAKWSKLHVVDLASNQVAKWSSIKALTRVRSLRSLSLRNNPVAPADSAPSAAVLKNFIAHVVKLFPMIETVDYKPVASYGLKQKHSVTVDFQKKWASKEARRQRNLVSNKLHQPDASKPRNKPCSCGSGIKYKLCCEKKQRESDGNKHGNERGSSKSKSSSKSSNNKIKQVTMNKAKSEEADPGLEPDASDGEAASESARQPTPNTQAETTVALAAKDGAMDEDERAQAEEAKAAKRKLLEALAKNDAQRMSGVVAVEQSSRSGNKKNSRKRTATRAPGAGKDVDGGNAKKQRVGLGGEADLATAIRATAPKLGQSIGNISAWD